MTIINFITYLVNIVNFAARCIMAYNAPGGAFDLTVTIVYVLNKAACIIDEL
jgi:hypothetical protein